MKKWVVLSLALAITVVGYAGVKSTPLQNPSFEAQNPILNPYYASPVTDWYDYNNSFIIMDNAYMTNYPATPYGNVMGGIENGGGMWQQIGLYDPNMIIDISMWLGKRNDRNFYNLLAQLWSGGTGEPADGQLGPGGILGAVKVAEVTMTPFPTGTTNPPPSIDPMVVSLKTGPGGTTGQRLWLAFEGTGGGGQRMLDNVVVTPKNVPANPVPESGQAFVLTLPTLQWTTPATYTTASYDLEWVPDNPTFLPGTPGYKTVTGLTTTSYTIGAPDTLSNDKNYYWRVTAYEPNETGSPIPRRSTWIFRTVPSQVYIQTQPVAQTVNIGGTAELTVLAMNVATYKWYKDGSAVSNGGNFSGSTTATLTISNVDDIGEEGIYHCEMTGNNPSDPAVQTNKVVVVSKRRIAKWSFEGGSLVSTTEGGRSWTGTIPDPNAAPGAGIIGDAYEFFGNGQVIQITNSEDFFNFYANGLTATAWVKTTASGYTGVVAKQGADSASGYLLGTFDNEATGGIRGLGISYSGDKSTNNNNWHMITLTYDTSDMNLYVDGVLAASETVGSNPSINVQPLIFGAELLNGSVPYTGLVDEIEIWSKAMSAVEVALLYVSTTPEADSICVELDPMDFNKDCRVDLEDLADFVANWLDCNIIPESSC